MSEGDSGVRALLKTDARVHFGKALALVEKRNLRVDYERRPRDRRKVQSIEDVGEIRAIERIVNVDVEEGFQFQPADRQVVSPGLEAVAYPEARDRPVIDRIDRGVLRKIDRVEFCGGLNAVKLEDGRGIDVWGRDIGKVGERLNNVTQAVESESAVLNLIPFAREFE